MNSNGSAVELRTIQKKYAYVKTDALMQRIFTNLNSCAENLQKMSFLEEIALSSDSESDSSKFVGGGHSSRCIDKMLSAKSFNELGILSTDTPPDMSSRQKVVFQRKKLKKYKNMYLGLSNLYSYIRNVAVYYYYLSLMSRKSNNTMMVKLNGLNDMIGEWSKKVGTDITITNNKVENIELMMNVLNKVLEKPIDVDLKVKGSVGKNVLRLDSALSTGDEKKGASKMTQVGGDFTDDYEEAKSKIKQIIDNNSFLNEKLESLQSRMKSVIEDNENLFTIRAKVEFVTNKLEECIKNKDDESAVQMVYDLNDLMNILQEYDSTKMVDVITSIDSLVAYLEKVLKKDEGTATKTLDSMNTSDKTALESLMRNVIESIGKKGKELGVKEKEVSVEEPFKGGARMGANRQTKQRGLFGGDITNLREDYSKKYELSVDNIKKSIDTYNKSESIIKLNQQDLDKVMNTDVSDPKLAETNLAKLVTLSLNLKQLNSMTISLVKLLEAFKPETLNWKAVWEIAFAHKTNTDFYTELLDKNVFNIVSGSGSTTFKELEISGSKPDYKYEIENIDEVDILNVTYTALCALYFALAKYIMCNVILQTDDKEGAEINKVSRLLRKMDQNLSKSFSHTFADHDHAYLSGSKRASTDDAVSLTKEQQSSIWMTDSEIEEITKFLTQATGSEKILLVKGDVTPTMVFFQEFTHMSNISLARDSNASVQGQLNDTVTGIKKKIDSVLLDAKTMFNRVATMLGYTDRFKSIVDKMETEKSVPNVSTFVEILDLLKTPKKVSGKLSGGFQKGGSLGVELVKGFVQLYRRSYQDYINLKRIEKYSHVQVGGRKKLEPNILPRIGAKRTKLQETFKKTMLDLVKVVYVLQKKLQAGGELSASAEVNAFIKLYGETKATVDTANNAFVRLLPMIFFAIEFPPELYMQNNPKSHYYITYNYPELVYNSLQKGVAPKKFLGYHQAFLAKNANDSTHDLITDRLIGLDTLTGLGNDPKQPKNAVSNIMFAVGASGTGKTTRYFGYRGTGGKTEDKVGVMEHIINTSRGKSRVDMAYFVCYGREKTSATDTMYDETLLFVRKNKFGDDFDIFPFTMALKESDKVPKETPITYTNFYTKLMSRKLCAMEPASFTDYALNKGDVACKKPVDVNLSFREVLEKTEDEESSIWTNISDTTQDGLKDLFQELITKQKQLRTVMPTVNNIESSRGHTCMLLKFTNRDTEKVSYFPLFDMAGTENVDGINQFYTDIDGDKSISNGAENMQRLVETLLRQEQKDKTAEVRYVANNKDVVSLKEIRDMFVAKLRQIAPASGSSSVSSPAKSIESGVGSVVSSSEKQVVKVNSEPTVVPPAKKDIGNPVSSKQTNLGKPSKGIVAKKPTIKEKSASVKSDEQDGEGEPIGLATLPGLEGGGKKEIVNIEEFLSGIKSLDDLVPAKEVSLVKKVRNEGAYINHTIAMIIFAVLCVGETQKAGTNASGEDTFDNILPEVQKKMKQSTLCNAELRSKGDPTCGPTMYLFNDTIDYHHILNNSSIWAQIVFGFLYWNSETADSTTAYFKSFLSDVGNNKGKLSSERSYTIDMSDPGYLYNFDRDISINPTIFVSLEDIASLDIKKLETFTEVTTNAGVKLYNSDTKKNDKLYLAVQGDVLLSLGLTGDVVEVTDGTDEKIAVTNAIKTKKSVMQILKEMIIESFRRLLIKDLGESMKGQNNPSAFENKVKKFTRSKGVINFVKAGPGAKPDDPNKFGFKKEDIQSATVEFCKKHGCYFIAASSFEGMNDTLKKFGTAIDVSLQDAYTALRLHYLDSINSIKLGWPILTEPELNEAQTTLTKFFSGLPQETQYNIVHILFTGAFDSVHGGQGQKLSEQDRKKLDTVLNSLDKQTRSFIFKNINEKRSDVPTKALSAYKPLIDLLSEYIKKSVDDKKDDFHRSQVERVRDPSRNFYPPMAVLMHCITGQIEKFEMVNATLEMSKTLYDAVNVTDASVKPISVFEDVTVVPE
ncbi:hypothetical protein YASMINEVIRUS_660 [Yasminevirus sp. GU-2018]|uniref:Kinesin motor domain-containing protein n=1 Tax=Yasminevirus sp. GU-2018 TaxID=2420051 RepID=A0A5K0U8I8_9VIRU|nr:hypothetical protein YASMINEVIRUS_660 [Yasminevirus sp. GU-2018]